MCYKHTSVTADTYLHIPVQEEKINKRMGSYYSIAQSTAFFFTKNTYSWLFLKYTYRCPSFLKQLHVIIKDYIF